MKILRPIVIILIVCGFTIVDVRSQEYEKPKHLDKFTSTFSGHNPLAVYQAFKSHESKFAKSQFETTEEFVARIRSLISKIKLTKTKSADEELTFVSNVFEQIYDADSEILTIALDLDRSSVPIIGDTYRWTSLIHDGLIRPLEMSRNNTWPALELASTSKTIRYASGRTAFGISMRYRVRTYTSTNLALKDLPVAGFSRPRVFLETIMPPARAREISKRTSIAITVRPRYPFIFEKYSWDVATLTSLEESHYTDYYLLCEPIRLAVFDRLTGEILSELLLSAKRLDLTPPVTGLSDSGQEPSVLPAPESSVGLFQLEFEDDLNEQAISLPKPAYPPAAKAVRAAGTVRVVVLIDENGSVLSANAVTGHPLLKAAAASAARGARFAPKMVNGRPVRRRGVLTYEFVP